jgi:hypothetical protein
MSDAEISSRIDELVEEEQRLRTARPEEDDQPRQARLQEVKVELDRLWDLLRQRRAQEEFGGDPDDAIERPGSVVEDYEQ